MAERRLARRGVTRLRGGTWTATRDTLIAEEPLEVRVDGEVVSVTMRTPGADFELALGFCLTEGLVEHDAVAAIRYCTDPVEGAGEHNVVDVAVRAGRAWNPDLARRVFTTSSCGVCGTSSIGAVRKRLPGVHDDDVTVTPATLAALPHTLRAGQQLFDRTGGLHAAGLFDADGDLLCLREDVGRHNAVDKVVGWAATRGLLPLRGHLLAVSGRVAFEIAQKALYAGLPVVAAVSAPSSLAVDLCEEAGITLVGFLRGSIDEPSMNVYTHAGRVT